MVTRRAIRISMGRRLKSLDDRDFYEFLNTGTASAALTDAVNLASTKYTAAEWENYYVRWSDGSGSSPDGAKVRSTTLVGSTGVLSLSPSLPAAAASGDTGELWHPKLDPDLSDRQIDYALANLCFRWRPCPLSSVVDADFLYDAL